MQHTRMHVRYMQGPEVPGRPKDASCIMQDIAATVSLAETLVAMSGEIGDSQDNV